MSLLHWAQSFFTAAQKHPVTYFSISHIASIILNIYVYQNVQNFILRNPIATECIHIENTVYTERTLREHSEKTRRTPREHPANTQKTLRALSENIQERLPKNPVFFFFLGGGGLPPPKLPRGQQVY